VWTDIGRSVVWALFTPLEVGSRPVAAEVRPGLAWPVIVVQVLAVVRWLLNRLGLPPEVSSGRKWNAAAMPRPVAHSEARLQTRGASNQD
jgi:hypothetical protein